MTKLHQLADLGQAIWLDYIRRSFVESGALQELIDQGLRGMTSNPSIFEKAIAGSEDYDADISRLAADHKSTQEIYEALAIADIRLAADLLRPVYNATHGDDGYVSLEVSPDLAHDTQGTLSEAKRLWGEVDRPNLMIKIPATKEGLPAISGAIAAGLNVNVTLIFSLERYAEVIQAYLQGLEQRQQAGEPLEQIASVASFFVSRVDSKVDKLLEAIIKAEGPQAALAASLLGRAAVNNARLAYQIFKASFEGTRFLRLASAGARLQRPLWASTSTKNPSYSDILYVQELIGEHTVNTLPQNTLEAFLDHGEVRLTLETEPERSRQEIDALAALGISMEQVTQELEDEGVSAFSRSYHDLLQSIDTKQAALNEQRSPFPVQLGAYQTNVQSALDRLAAENVLERIWKQDYTVWKPDPAEIRNRLGWLNIADEMLTRVGQLEALAFAVQQAGYRRAVLLGMGGSSLAPEFFARTFGSQEGFPELVVLDSTDPGAVLALERTIEYTHTLFIVSTKSGGTVETLSFLKYFHKQAVASLGSSKAGDHFIAITDPGSKLVDIARSLNFRAIFLNDPSIGGRYSALSYFGLVPAAICGIDLQRLLHSAQKMAAKCRAGIDLEQNPAAWLGAVLGTLAQLGRDKLTFILTAPLASFGDWVEQLIAESTGKEGKGILPVVGETLVAPELYGSDRLFASISLRGEAPSNAMLYKLEAAGHPVLRIEIEDCYDLGGQFFLWEMATAIAGHILGINPFDQPNVEAAKQRARQMVAAYQSSGTLPVQQPDLQTDSIGGYGTGVADSLYQALTNFIDQAKAGDYICIQAFVQPHERTSTVIDALREALRLHTRLATTKGYGPRFLHSTGQLHKGDAGNGLFIQLTAAHKQDLPIPAEIDSSVSNITFGVLIQAQALGDQQALLDAGRRVVRFHFDADTAQAIERLTAALG